MATHHPAIDNHTPHYPSRSRHHTHSHTHTSHNHAPKPIPPTLEPPPFHRWQHQYVPGWPPDGCTSWALQAGGYVSPLTRSITASPGTCSFLRLQLASTHYRFPEQPRCNRCGHTIIGKGFSLAQGVWGVGGVVSPPFTVQGLKISLNTSPLAERLFCIQTLKGHTDPASNEG